MWQLPSVLGEQRLWSRSTEDLLRILSGSSVDPQWILSRSSVDPQWILSRSSVDPQWILSGSSVDPLVLRALLKMCWIKGAGLRHHRAPPPVSHIHGVPFDPPPSLAKRTLAGVSSVSDEQQEARREDGEQETHGALERSALLREHLVFEDNRQ
ncbi:hypothetical protein EYF80_067658 [Liparis tanakae]|uniref:Uncharacterized protein n=1 Tax=Liparis tanakae TaxID=230148 RepID=A0A4Z2E0H9_9TELE|nr:hypothetical protein EYF80_067658 [Liparis tanakae]